MVDAAVQPVGDPRPEGTLVGDRFRLGPVRGRGRQGISYAAADERTGRAVVVTELLPVGAVRRDGRVVGLKGFDAVRRQVAADARTLARFAHPHVVRVVAVLDEAGTTYVVLDAVAGEALADVLATAGPLPEGEALDAVQHAADALAAVRLAGLVPPVLDPSSLVRRPDGHVVLVDPGLGPATDADRPPPVDDVAALGALLHHLLVGAPPPAPGPDGPTLLALEERASRGTVDAVRRALALDPAVRPATPGELLCRLGLGDEGLGVPTVVDLRDDPLRPLRRPAAASAAPAAPPAAPAPAAPASLPDGLAGVTWLVGDLAPWRPPLVPAAATVALVAPVVAPSGRAFPVPVPVGPTTTGRLPRLGVHHPVPAAAAPPDPTRTVPPGRRALTVPLGTAAVALASARPAASVVVLGVALAPLVATFGDRVVAPARARAWAPVWWARNVVIGAVRTAGALVVVFLGGCLWLGATAQASLVPAAPWLVRGTGAVAGAVLALSVGRGGEGFRSHLGLDALTRRVLPHGRPTPAAVAVVVLALALVLLGLGLAPSPWPL